MAAEHGAETAIYDGQFNAELQYNQIEDVLAGGNFDAFIVLPNDTVGIAGAFEQVIAAGTPIATTLFPVGPDLNTLEPQVEGITATVASLPVPGATLQAEDLAAHCEGVNPCNVVILIGAKIFPFDVLRMETFMGVFDKHENIDVVAVGEGWYDPDTSLTVMTDILQANPEIHAIISVGDQQLLGAEIALEVAGHNVPDLYISGGGAATVSIEAIREGRWDATLRLFPAYYGRASGGGGHRRHSWRRCRRGDKSGRCWSIAAHRNQRGSGCESGLPRRMGAVNFSSRGRFERPRSEIRSGNPNFGRKNATESPPTLAEHLPT